jgi:hypothetical protein
MPRRECLHKSIVINLIRAILVAFTLIVKSRPREAARHRQHSQNRTRRLTARLERAVIHDPTGDRFDAQLADCRIDRRGATMVTRTTPPLLVQLSSVLAASTPSRRTPALG